MFNKLDETIDVNAKIVRNKVYNNELLKEISRVRFSESCIVEAIKQHIKTTLPPHFNQLIA